MTAGGNAISAWAALTGSPFPCRTWAAVTSCGVSKMWTRPPGPFVTRLRSFFLMMELRLAAHRAACAASSSSRSIEKPIALVVSQLRNAEQTGVLPEASLALSSTTEMRELAESYTRAADLCPPCAAETAVRLCGVHWLPGQRTRCARSLYLRPQRTSEPFLQRHGGGHGPG